MINILQIIISKTIHSSSYLGEVKFASPSAFNKSPTDTFANVLITIFWPQNSMNVLISLEITMKCVITPEKESYGMIL